MNATDLQHIVTDFAELPSRRHDLLCALPGFLRKHFAGASVVSGVYDEGLRVLASSHPQVKTGVAPPGAEAALEAIRTGECARGTAAEELPGLSHTAAWPLRERMTDIATL